MTTSGVFSFRTNRDEVIKGALRLCSAYDFENGQTPTATQISLAAESLNLIVKSLESRELQLWARRYAVVFPQKNQSVFSLGNPNSGGDHACLSQPLGLGGFVNTTLSNTVTAGAGTIVVASTTSNSSAGVTAVTITSGYNIGIVLDDGSLFWTTVNGAPSGSTVTLTATMSGNATAGNRVFCYQTKLMRPLRILDAFSRNIEGDNDTPIKIIPKENYNRFGQKNTATGLPTQLAFDRQVNSGVLYLYPGFQDCSRLVVIEFEKPFDDLLTSTDDYDFTQEWGEFLKCRLALALAPEYEVSETKFKQLKELAVLSYDLVNTADQENASVFLQPDNQQG